MELAMTSHLLWSIDHLMGQAVFFSRMLSEI